MGKKKILPFLMIGAFFLVVFAFNNAYFLPSIADTVEYDMKFETRSLPVVDNKLFAKKDTVKTVPQQEKKEQFTYEHCPFGEQEGRTIVIFGEEKNGVFLPIELHANASLEESQYEKRDVQIKTGTYNVQVASHHSTSAIEHITHYDERWYMTLYSADDRPLYTSVSTRDMQSDEEKVIEFLDNSMYVRDSVHSIILKHSAYPDTYSQTVTPLCIAFNVVQEQDRVSANNDGYMSSENKALSINTLGEKGPKKFALYYMLMLSFALMMYVFFYVSSKKIT